MDETRTFYVLPERCTIRELLAFLMAVVEDGHGDLPVLLSQAWKGDYDFGPEPTGPGDALYLNTRHAMCNPAGLELPDGR